MPTTARIEPGDHDPRHGTLNGYCNLRCRCRACADAHTAYCLRRRHERAAELAAGGPGPREHGTEPTYSNWGCRCAPCTEAKRLDGERRRRARSARTVRSFTDEWRRRVVEHAQETTATAAAREFGVARSVVYRWADRLGLVVVKRPNS